MAEAANRKSHPLFDRLTRRRHRYPEQGEIILHRRRVYILPTRTGLAFSLLLLLMLVGSINYNNNLGYAFTFLLGSITTLSMLFTHRNLQGLSLRIAKPEPVFAGNRACIVIHLYGNGRHRFAIRLQAHDISGTETDIGQNHAIIRLFLPTNRRGLHYLPAIRCFTAYPYGLFQAWSWITPDETLLVYPAPEEKPPPPVPHIAEQGHAKPTHTDGNDDFRGLRGYRHGDPGSRIAWKQEARTGDLAVKLFSGQSGHSLVIDWEMTAGLPIEKRLSRIARWIIEAESMGQPYGLSLPNKHIPPSAGRTHLDTCLTALALFDQQREPA